MDNQNISAPIEELQKRVQTLLPKLPALAGNIVVNFALDNFKRQGFMSANFQPWPKRKDPTKWGQHPKRNGRNILVLTGRLRRGTRVIRANWNEVVVGNDAPYAKAQNDGVRLGEIQTVKSFTRKQTYAGLASKFKVNGEEFKTGSVMSINGRRNLKSVKVQAPTQVAAHKRRIDQNIPARPYLANSPYLNSSLQRGIGAEIMRVFK